MSIATSSKDVVESLNHVLANEYSLFTKTLSYHWNITGPRFHSLHVFLGDQYNQLLVMMDEVAERVRMLNERPLSTIKGMYATMEIKDGQEKDKTLSAEMMLENLAKDHSTIQGQIKEILMDSKKFSDDPGSQDLLTDVLRKHEKMSWMLHSHLLTSKQ